MSLADFINKWNGKYVSSRGGITGQCVSLAQAWAEANGVGGTPVFPVGAAKDMAGARSDAFSWIANTPTNVPQAGDIIVWGTALGQYGHTGVFVSGDANSFVSFDQNFPIGTAAHKQWHNYTGVLGWLRLKNNNTGGDMGVPNVEYDKVVVENYNLGVALRNEQAKTAHLTNLLNEANGLVENLKKELDKAGVERASLDKKIEELNQKIDQHNQAPSSLDNFSVGDLLSAVWKKLFKIK